MPENVVSSVADGTDASRRQRDQIAGILQAYERAKASGVSQRDFAASQGIPHSSLQHWLARQESIAAPPEAIAFFESPVGVAWLHQMVIAAHVVMSQMGACGVGLICQFLHLSGLSAFVGSSYGSQYALAVAMEEHLVSYGVAETQRLGSTMVNREITACLDETFHPEVCLVGIEPASNFILVETYSERRDAESWEESLNAALTGLPVTIRQVTSDAASGLLRYAQEILGVPHSPDLFHIQRELVRATAWPLAQQHRHAQKAVAQAESEVARATAKRERYQRRPRPGRRPSFEVAIERAEQALANAQQALVTVEQHQEQAQAAIQGISHTYHPLELDTGVWRPPAAIEAELTARFGTLEQIITQADLPDYAQAKFAKAKRQLSPMVETLHRFDQHRLTQALNLPQLGLATLEHDFQEHLLPAVYLNKVAAQTSDSTQRHALQATVEQLLRPLRDPDAPIQSLSADRRHHLEALALACVQTFQRSSSCVEGRNGQLALRHHSFHRLSPRKLQALTTIHNFFLTRPDGSTAAERFFGHPPNPLFDSLLQALPLPPRPARNRPLASKPYLLDIA